MTLIRIIDTNTSCKKIHVQYKLDGVFSTTSCDHVQVSLQDYRSTTAALVWNFTEKYNGRHTTSNRKITSVIMHCRYILAAAFVLVCGGHVFSEDGATFVRDLTHKLHSGIPTHSAVLKPTIQTYFSSLQNVIYKIENISTASHVGTHVDAPSHFANGTWDIDEIPLQRLFAPAVVVDIRYKTLKDPESGLSPADLITWELKYGKIPDGAVILVLTGWDRYWKDPRKYLRIEEDGAKGSPGVSGEAAEWIVENTKAYGIGVDGISIDTGNDVIAHLILCRNSLYLIENLKDVDKIPPVGATLYVLPLKIKSASGAPARVISTYPV